MTQVCETLAWSHCVAVGLLGLEAAMSICDQCQHQIYTPQYHEKSLLRWAHYNPWRISISQCTVSGKKYSF